ncbi:MAG: hypothetical protein ACJA1R_003054 [Flavobacteriales bacterium]
MSAPPQLVLWGVGQLGRLYAGGALRAGYSVTPITRSTDPLPALLAHPEGTPILCAVGEDAIDAVVEQVPIERRDDLIFVQNELFSSQLEDWKASAATLAVVWTLCKPKLPLIVSRATAVGGRHAGAVAQWHACLDLPCQIVEPSKLGVEAAAKYAFVVAINALGVREARPVGQWLAAEPELAEAVVNEAVLLSAVMAGHPRATPEIAIAVNAGLAGFAALPTRGRTAQQRVARALRAAERLQVAMPVITGILGE